MCPVYDLADLSTDKTQNYPFMKWMLDIHIKIWQHWAERRKKHWSCESMKAAAHHSTRYVFSSAPSCSTTRTCACTPTTSRELERTEVWSLQIIEWWPAVNTTILELYQELARPNLRPRPRALGADKKPRAHKYYSGVQLWAAGFIKSCLSCCVMLTQLLSSFYLSNYHSFFSVSWILWALSLLWSWSLDHRRVLLLPSGAFIHHHHHSFIPCNESVMEWT